MKNNSKTLTLFITIIMILCVITLFGCDKVSKGETINDDDYAIIIKGIGVNDISITKAQIKEIYNEKPVNYEGENKVYASDKTDENGNLI